MRTSPPPSTFGGRDSSETTCRCSSRSSAASSTVTIRSSAGTLAETALSSVVLPVPVPPEMRMLSLPWTHWARNSAVCSVIEPRPIRFSSVSASRANFRIVSDGPRSESGGMIALTRLPSGRRASTIGDASSIRRPTWETIRSMIRSRCASSRNDACGLLDLSGTLDVDLVRPVDHDLGDGGVVQEGLERAVAEDVGGDLLLERGAVVGAERRLFAVQLLDHDLAHAPHQLVAALEAEERVPEPGDARSVDLRLQLGVRVTHALARAPVDVQALGEDRRVGAPHQAVALDRAHRRPRRRTRR